MSCPHNEPFPFSSYAEYVTKLAELDSKFNQLQHFFAGSLSPAAMPFRNISIEGSVNVIDVIDNELQFKSFPVSPDGFCADEPNLVSTLQARPETSKFRIIFIDYFRSWGGGNFSGLSTDIIDVVSRHYRLHPDMIRLHFGSNYGLDDYFFPQRENYTISPIIANNYLHLEYGHSFLSATFHADCNCTNKNSVVVLARNENCDNEIVKSDLIFLDSSLPDVQQKFEPWTNIVYLKTLQKFTRKDVSDAVISPVEFLLPYGQIVSVTENYLMTVWQEKLQELAHWDGGRADWRVDEQYDTLEKTRANLRELKRFATSHPSTRWASMISTLQRLVVNFEAQVDRTRQKVDYLATSASLTDSKLSIEASQLALRQGDQMRAVTILAFIFIPISTVTSIFGMNLTTLGSGEAQIWMVIAGAVIAYVSVAVFWLIIRYWKRARILVVKALKTAKSLPQDADKSTAPE